MDGVREALADLVQRRFLLEVAAAFALAWAVVGLVSAFVATVVSWGATKSAETSNSLSDAFGDIYDFDLFGHTLDLRSLVAELVTALLVLAVVLVVLRRVPREE
jgi:hypothetical protein